MATKVINEVSGSTESPLKFFGQAKDRVNELFQKLDNAISETYDYYTHDKFEPQLLDDEAIRIGKFKQSISTIRSILARNQMKVAFFGRTSNGKSTVINAILHDRVLPSGYGHTTGCFLQIQGSEEGEAYFEIIKHGKKPEKKPLQSIEEDVNALYSHCLEHSALVKIYWPISKCPLLRYDVVLVDSPGVDVEDNLDEWIDEHCHDADVFVLVSNAESTLNNAEKKFFHRVSEKLSKPNIFILNNRWDSIAEDPKSMTRVRSQHLTRAVDFLSDELRLSSIDEAKKKTFFVSAKEMLQARSPDPSSPTPIVQRHGLEERNQEFIKFERCFEESLSRSAVQTKFQKHTVKGINCVEELIGMLRGTRTLIKEQVNLKTTQLEKHEKGYERIDSEFFSKIAYYEKDMQDIKKRILLATEKEFYHEVSRLSRIVDNFDMKFSPNPGDLNLYKLNLYAHVEEALSENLFARVNTVITKNISSFRTFLSMMSHLLSDERLKNFSECISSQNYVQDDLFDLKIYRQFYTDFQEDLEFRFSLGLFTIVKKLRLRFSGNKPSANLDSSQTIQADTDLVSIMERFLISSPQSPTTVGSLAVGGILVRTVGWRVIVVTTVIYGALYAYEYLTWTTASKERAFKAQYTKFARKGLHDCVPIITQHIANSVEKKMYDMFFKLKNELDGERAEYYKDANIVRSAISNIHRLDTIAGHLLDQHGFLMNEIIAFASSFLNFSG